MRRFIFTALFLGSAVALTAPAFAQRYPDPYYGNRDPYYGRNDPDYGGNRDPYYGNNRGRYGNTYYDPVDRALDNLQRAASTNRYDHHERSHFDKAIHELSKFRDRWHSNGHFDRGALDKAISNMNDLSRARQLHPRDRDLIGRDLYDLRAFRDGGGGGYGPYGNGRRW
jgi:hypothetical protein